MLADRLLILNLIMSQVNWEKYSKESIDFILNQSEKTILETFVSYREVTNKSYSALAIYSSILSYCILQIIEGQNTSTIYFSLLSLGLISSIAVIFVNLKPKLMTFVGSSKSLLCQKYFENEIELNKQIDEYKILTIETYDEGIKMNLEVITAQIMSFKNSIYIFIGSILAVFFIFLLTR